MLKSYVAGGLDHARFWEITPRLYDLEMQGVRARIQRERGLVWESVNQYRAETMTPHAEFVGLVAKAQPEGTLGLWLRASNKGLKVMSLDEWRAKRGRGG